MDAWPLGRYLKSVSLLLAICPSHALPLLSLLSRRVDVVFFPRYSMSFVSITKTRLSYKCTPLHHVHDSFCTFVCFFSHLLLLLPLFGHLSIQDESKQFVYEMCKWDMRRCDRDGIMEKTLIRLYRCCCCRTKNYGVIWGWRTDFVRIFC